MATKTGDPKSVKKSSVAKSDYSQKQLNQSMASGNEDAFWRSHLANKAYDAQSKKDAEKRKKMLEEKEQKKYAKKTVMSDMAQNVKKK